MTGIQFLEISTTYNSITFYKLTMYNKIRFKIDQPFIKSRSITMYYYWAYPLKNLSYQIGFTQPNPIGWKMAGGRL